MKHLYNRPATELDYRKRINQAMRYIQDHMGEPLSIPDIASAANFSSFHFHRIFTAFVGETVGDYLKRIRMTHAASLVAEGWPTKQIALTVGYKTSSAFIQVFKSTFGSAPSTLKKQATPGLTHFPKSISHSQSLNAEPVDPKLTGTDLHDPVSPQQPLIRDQPAMQLFYIRTRGKVKESFTAVAGEAFDNLHDWLEKHSLRTQVLARLGILRDIDLISPDQSRFDACVAFPPGLSPIPEKGIENGRLAAGKCAVFLHKGPYDTLWQTWNWIYRHWIPANGLELRDADPFEIYLNDRRQTAATDLLTEINIPLA